MKRTIFVLVLLLLYVFLGACGTTETRSSEGEDIISEDKAISNAIEVITEDFQEDKENIEIKSVKLDSGYYVVEWVIDEDCEFGSITIDANSGDLHEFTVTEC
ncbi:hypothetical protein [Aquisalibacillus elongatus]|uniref:Putative small secreted protein n=1 Tax=Aquisalibacillus elongatus TaxID=485577 RepID=A0A3N5C282_9BACI|nr:hypothetical protein [Aquisalibacillus elongatus]RPF53472.1 putative small secreted protein [Aquisalibacillus elongatus]